MNWRIWLNALLVSILSGFVSCQDQPEDVIVEKDPEIKVIPANPEIFNASGGEISLSLFANTDWTVNELPYWISVTPDSGLKSNYTQTVVLSVEENSGGEREAVLTFTAKDVSATVKVQQKHAFGSDVPSNTVFFEGLTSSIGKFEIKDVTVPSGLKSIWEYSSEYKCMKATAYSNGVNYESESWLISPEIDLRGTPESYLTFEHAGGYFGTASDEATVWISKDNGDWEELEINDEDYPTTWTFMTAGNWDLSSYYGGKIRLGFRYSSTSKKAGTWEIRNISVFSGKYKDTTIPQADPTKAVWMELPSTDNKNLKYISHRFEMNKQIYRNYTIGWSQKDLVSLWVAYPLNSTYTKANVTRTDAWAYDPVLGDKLSSAPFGYYAGDYARGHQLPSADRLCSTAANKQTFYGTNITPQLNEHNEGIWLTLEDHVRTIANASDTTYIVTGCVVDGATEFSTDSDGKTITIPVAYYKALLYYKKGAETEWACAAFYTDHKNYKDNSLKKVAMSVDALEEKLGLDFFVHLSDKIGKEKADALEAQDPTTVALWKLN